MLSSLSFPVRERGLKRLDNHFHSTEDIVVPLVETCIETRNEEVRLGVTVESYFLICSKSFFKRVAAVNRSRTMQS